MSDGERLKDVRCTLVSVENQLLKRLNDRAERMLGGDEIEDDEIEDDDDPGEED